MEVFTGELHEANTRIDQIENDITKYAQVINDTYERLLSLERYSRDYNLRFYNISDSTGEDCIAKFRDILESELQLQPSVENAHRIGPRPIFWNTLELSRRRGIYVMVCVFHTI